VLLLLVAMAASLTVGSRPGTCSLCHSEISQASASSPHKAVSCYDCHVESAWDLPRQKLSEVFVMYRRAIVGGRPAGPVRQTARGACLDCHSDVEGSVSTGAYIRINHAACAQQASCDGCHTASAHGSTGRWLTGPVMGTCLSCHESKGISVDCGLCHLEPGKASLNSRAPWRVTHGPDWEKTHGLGDPSSCETCHEPSDYDSTGFCKECHKVDVPHPPDFGGSHGETATANREACHTCHDEESMCQGCHQIEMPHPADFTREHTDVAQGEQDQRCLRCHVEGDCLECHLNHIHPGGGKGVPVPWDTTNEGLRPTS
jgi:hypothetical protein